MKKMILLVVIFIILLTSCSFKEKITDDVATPSLEEVKYDDYNGVIPSEQVSKCKKIVYESKNDSSSYLDLFDYADNNKIEYKFWFYPTYSNAITENKARIIYDNEDNLIIYQEISVMDSSFFNSSLDESYDNVRYSMYLKVVLYADKNIGDDLTIKRYCIKNDDDIQARYIFEIKSDNSNIIIIEAYTRFELKEEYMLSYVKKSLRKYKKIEYDEYNGIILDEYQKYQKELTTPFGYYCNYDYLIKYINDNNITYKFSFYPTNLVDTTGYYDYILHDYNNELILFQYIVFYDSKLGKSNPNEFPEGDIVCGGYYYSASLKVISYANRDIGDNISINRYQIKSQSLDLQRFIFEVKSGDNIVMIIEAYSTLDISEEYMLSYVKDSIRIAK